MILNNNDFKVIIGKNVPDTDAPVTQAPEDKSLLLYNISEAIRDGGYDPVSQIVGFLISDDPTHISNHQNARTMINRIDRDELLSEIVTAHLERLRAEYGNDSQND